MRPLNVRPSVARWVLVLAVLVVFGRLFWCDFTWWDDWVTVHQNPKMNPVGWDTFAFNWSHPTASIYIPLTYTVWALVALVSRVPPDDFGIGLNATFFHATNVLIHAGGALAAYALLRRLVKHDTAALLGALVWAVHPVQVESVGWVSGLKDVLSGTLVMTSAWLYVAWRQDERPGRRRYYRYAAALAVYALAMLAKPAAFTLPLLLIVIDRLIIGKSWRKTATAMVAFAVVTIPIAVVARASQPAPASAAPAWTRPLVAGDALAFYAVTVVAPVRLAFDYGRSIDWLRGTRELYVAWLLPLTVAIAVAGSYRRARRAGRTPSPLPAAALLLFTLAPVHVLGLVRFDFQVISVVADHYLYVAMIGPALLLAWAVARWPQATTAAAVLVAAMGARAAWQTPVWQDDRSLMSHALSINPRSWTAYVNLAELNRKTGNIPAQHDCLLKAEAIDPENPTVFISLISMYLDAGEDDTAMAYAHKLLDVYARIYYPAGGPITGGYGKAINPFLQANRLDEAEALVKEGLALDPRDASLQKYAERIQWLREAAARRTPATQP